MFCKDTDKNGVCVCVGSITSVVGWRRGRGAVRLAVAPRAAAVAVAVTGKGPAMAGVTVAGLGVRPWLCWMKAAESGVSWRRAGRLLWREQGRNTHTVDMLGPHPPLPHTHTHTQSPL